ncbi:MAG TPA: DUF3794 domain-containing protein [Bacillota bacterium]|nr:DUF3794 domain-containing protein [Bacillota bacterium]
MDPLIRAEVVIGENTKQILIERNVTLTIPAIKVRNINATIRNITTDVIADKVVIQGILHKQIFFVGEDNIVHHQAEDIPFSTFVDIPGAEPGMNVQVDPVIETIIFSLLTPTVVHQKVVVEFFVKVTETRQLNVVIGTGPLVRVDQVVGENTKQELFENFVTLITPAIKIDDITVVIRNITTHIINDKVIIQGTIHKQIFFVGTNNIEFHQAEDIDFSTFVDIPGAVPGMDVEVVPTVEFIHFELRDATTVLQKVVVEFFAKVTESVQINILPGPGALLKLDTVIGENTNQILVENVFTLPLRTVKIREIIAVIKDLTTEVINDKVVIQGILHKQIFFIAEDNLEHHQAEDIPFSTFVDIIGTTPGMNVRVDPKIETILFELEDATTLRQKVVIEFFVKVTETQQLSVQIVSPYYF